MQNLQTLKLIEIAASLLWTLALLYGYLKNKSVNVRLLKSGIIVLMSVFIATAYFSTSIQFQAWKNDPMSRYLLPPYVSIDYFYSYAIYRFWLPYALDIMISIAWAFFLLLLCRYSHGRFLDEKEACMGFFTALVVGWPNFIIYVFIVFSLVVIRQLFNYYILHERKLISITSYMAISAIIVLVLSLYYSDKLGLDKLKLVS